jgi:hypothetical protein
MEKVIAVLMRADSDDDWCARQRGPVAEALLNLGIPGLSVNVRDEAVRHSLMTLTTLDPPVAGEHVDPAELWRTDDGRADPARG